MHKFEGLTDHPEVSIRSHYTAQVIDEKENSAKPGSSAAGMEYDWVDKEKVSLLHFDFLRQQTHPILDSPAKVWGGTFSIIWKDDVFQGSKILEPIHALSD